VIHLSQRFAAALLALAGAAATLQHTVLRGARGEDPCASPGAIKATSLIPGTTALGERLEALDADVIQWSEGEVANPVLAKLPMRFQIVRSFDAPALYVNPLGYAALQDPRLTAGGHDEVPATAEQQLQPEELRVREASVGGVALPIHMAWDHTQAPRGPSRLVAWFFVFDNEPVRSPLSSQLEHALSLAAGGPRPLTLVTISALASGGTAGEVEAAASAWLENAWAYIARSCKAR
jgi:hypothetical protein